MGSPQVCWLEFNTLLGIIAPNTALQRAGPQSRDSLTEGVVEGGCVHGGQ